MQADAQPWPVRSLNEVAGDFPNATTIGPFGSNLVADDYRIEGVPVVFVRDIKEEGFAWKSDVYIDPGKAQELAAHQVLPGDVLATKMGLPPCISCVYPTEMPPGIITADVIRLRPNLEVAIPSWVSRQINAPSIRKQVGWITGGVTRPKVTLKDFRSLRIATPPITEQARVAEVLDILDEAIQGTEVLLEKLLAAKQGLLMDTFEAKANASAVPLGHYLQGIDAGKSPDCPEKPAQAGEWGVLKVSAIVRSGFRPNENKAVLNPVHFNTTYEVHPGDLLITRANTYDLIAQACVVRETPPRLMLCDKTLRLKPNAKASAEFLSIALTTPTARRHIEINATGSSGTMKNITQGAIRDIPIPNLDRTAQDQVTSQMAAVVARIEAEAEELNKLKSLKFGLTSDLLTGHVRTTHS